MTPPRKPPETTFIVDEILETVRTTYVRAASPDEALERVDPWHVVPLDADIATQVYDLRTDGTGRDSRLLLDSRSRVPGAPVHEVRFLIERGPDLGLWFKATHTGNTAWHGPYATIDELTATLAYYVAEDIAHHLPGEEPPTLIDPNPTTDRP